MSSTRFLQITRPKPLPPNLRVVDASACVKRWNNCGRAWAAMPTPVSRTCTCNQMRGSSARPVDALAAQRYVALVGELDRVSQQIRHNLPKPRRVTPDVRARARIELRDKDRSRAAASSR